MGLRRVTKKAVKEGVRDRNLRRVGLKVAPDLIDFGIDAAFKAYDHRKQRPPEAESPPVERRVYGAEAKDYEGQSDLDYCISCSIKHSQTAKVLMREALQRAEAGDPSLEGVQEKVRGVVEELCGLEDDTDTVESEMVTTLNTLSRELRKFIYTTGAEVGKASIEHLRDIKDMVNKLVDAAYQVRESEECVGCTVESICGGNIECVEFVEESIRGVKAPEAIRNVLVEARERYGRR